MSDNVISLRAYQKSCTRCDKQILMSPTGTPAHKWLALEVESKELHRCISSNGNTKSNEITPQKTVQKEELAVVHHQHIHTNDVEILALKKRVLALENWVKRMKESAMMNL